MQEHVGGRIVNEMSANAASSIAISHEKSSKRGEVKLIKGETDSC